MTNFAKTHHAARNAERTACGISKTGQLKTEQQSAVTCKRCHDALSAARREGK